MSEPSPTGGGEGYEDRDDEMAARPPDIFASEYYCKERKITMKTMKNVSKKSLALLLALVMCLGMVNMTAFAANDPCPECSQDTLRYDSGKQATCTTDGKTAGNHCTNENCGYTTQTVIPAKHTNLTNLTRLPAYDIPATCVEAGNAAYYCLTCKGTVYGESIPATGVHTYENGKCTVCGKACEHGTTEAVAKKNATCTQEGWPSHTLCTICGVRYTGTGGTVKYVDPTGVHIYGDWTYVAERGLDVRTCTYGCGAEETKDHVSEPEEPENKCTGEADCTADEHDEGCLSQKSEEPETPTKPEETNTNGTLVQDGNSWTWTSPEGNTVTLTLKSAELTCHPGVITRNVWFTRTGGISGKFTVNEIETQVSNNGGSGKAFYYDFEGVDVESVDGNRTLSVTVHSTVNKGTLSNPNITEDADFTFEVTFDMLDGITLVPEHTYGEWVVDKEATTTEAGSRHRDCVLEDDTQTETIPMIVPLLTATNDGDKTGKPGETVEWTVTLTNNGTDEVPMGVVLNSIPTGLSIEYAGNPFGGRGSILPLASGRSAALTVKYTIPEDAEAGTVEFPLTFSDINITAGGTASTTLVAQWQEAEQETPTPTPTDPDPVVTTYPLTVNYVYEDGSAASTAYTASLAAGATYNVASPAIEGYTPDQSVVSGVMPAANVTVTVVYTPVDEPIEDDIIDEEPPLAEIPDEEPPLANLPKEPEDLTEDDIDDEDVPLADVPKTGDHTNRFLVMAAVSGMCLLTLLSGRKKEDEA